MLEFQRPAWGSALCMLGDLRVGLIGVNVQISKTTKYEIVGTGFGVLVAHQETSFKKKKKVTLL